MNQRNALVRSMDASKEGVMLCENGSCRDELGMDLGGVSEAVSELK